MDTRNIIADSDLELFVRDILFFESDQEEKKTRLPFFADGYPGVIYRQSEKKAYLLPRGKELSGLFLYGQTLDPIELEMHGVYSLIVFQLYPFAAKLLFDVDPRKLNNDCYDLSKSRAGMKESLLTTLKTASEKELQMRILAEFLSTIARGKGMEEYRLIQKAIEIVVDRKGLITVGELAQLLNLSERTLQRRFNYYVGIAPKKFAKIIQFQSSVTQISSGAYSKLTDVVYENGYADQSHFIRNIKKFTGKRPLELKGLD